MQDSTLELAVFNRGTWDLFRPMPVPRPGEWLADGSPGEGERSGQSFDDYEGGRRSSWYRRHVRKILDSGRNVLQLVAFDDGGHDDGLQLKTIASFCSIWFGLQVTTTLLPSQVVDGFQSRQHQRRKQILTTDVQHHLSSQMPRDAFCSVALTNDDLYPGPKWNFVFGEANPNTKVGVFSFCRYKSANEARYLRRCLSVVVHEIGHLFGIEHCVYYLCNMDGSNHLEESDRQPLALCPIDLRKLCLATGVCPIERQRALCDWFQQHGLAEEEEWGRRWLAAIEGGS